ncbi:MAG: SurA N-terminal domain-containing protein [Oscillospiraceae bacterium]|jgi:hypothetical protein|nr:SurA N-terminal domain-containing protein [Oscillospiraceae bacterium]
MANINEQERYRKERKKRLAKEAKKAGKKTAKVDGTSVIVKIVAVLLAVTVVCGLGYLYGSSFGIPNRLLPVIKVGKNVVTVPEYVFYFDQQYSQYAQYAQTYGDFIGLNTKISPFDQKSPYTDEDEKPMTWDAYLDNQSKSQMTDLLILSQEAEKAGIKPSEDDKVEIDGELAQQRETANLSGLSLSAYLRVTLLPGITEHKFRSFLERDAVVRIFQEKKQEEFRGNHTDAELQKDYDDNPSEYNIVSLRAFAFQKTPVDAQDETETDEQIKVRQGAADAETKKKAEAMLAAVKDEASFLAQAREAKNEENYDAANDTAVFRKSKADLASYGEDAAKWLFAAERKAGEATVVENETTFYVLYLVRTQYPATTVNYYAYSFPYPTASDGSSTPSDADKANTKKSADAFLAKWKEAGATADAFVQLVKETAGESAPEDGGLKEKVRAGGTGEGDKVETWVFADERKAGDAAALESASGYAVILYSKTNTDDFVWKTDLMDKKVSDDFTAYLEELRAKPEYKVKSYDFARKRALKEAKKKTDEMVQQALSSGAY